MGVRARDRERRPATGIDPAASSAHGGRRGAGTLAGRILELSRLAGNGAVTALLARHGGIRSAAPVQRQHVQMQDGSLIGDVAGGPRDNRRENVLAALDRLHETWGVSNSEYNAAYPPVRRALPGQSVAPRFRTELIRGLGRNEQPELAAPVASNLFRVPFSGPVGRGQANATADVLALLDGLLSYGQISDADHGAERTAAAGASPSVPDAVLPHTLGALTRFKVANVAGAVRRDVMVGVRPATSSQATAVASILNPGSRVSVRSGGVAVYHPPPPMTGGGPGGPFETDMLAALRANVGGWAADLRRRRSGAPSMPVASMVDLFRAAQQELELHFGPYITAAARNPADRYHPGSYDAGTKVAAATSRVIDPGTRRGWTDYWMTLDRGSALTAPYPQEVLNRYHADDAEQLRVRELYALGTSSAADLTDIDDAIHGWPAESGGPVIFLDEYREFANVTEERRTRWDIFTTALHEILHILAHPNFEAASNALGSSAQKFLSEGLLEVMRHDLWDGPDGLVHRLGSAEMAPLRQRVEGAVYPYDASVIVYHPDYAEHAQGQRIDAQVGRANTRAAFFLGQMDLLGLGPGSPGGGRLTGLAAYDPSDRRNADVVTPLSGEKGDELAVRVGVAVGALRDARTGRALTSTLRTGALPSGMAVRAPGVRHVRAVDGDTVGSVARQNFVTVADLARAKALGGATAATPLTAGARIIIPPHAAPY